MKNLFRTFNKNRELKSLLQGGTRRSNDKDGDSGAVLMNQLLAAKAYTTSLRSSLELLQKELELSRINSESLSDANQNIQKIADQSNDYRADVGQSKSLIMQLKRRDVIDKMLTLAALAFFLLVVAYVVFSR